MRLATLALLGLGIVSFGFLSTSAAYGQGGPNVTLQLPTYSTFGSNTTVIVPNSGTSAVARQRQAFYERTMYRGLPTQRSLGLTRQGADLQVNAQFHDPREADAALLRRVRERRATWNRGSVDARGLSAPEPSNARPVLRSLADIERERAEREQARAIEARRFLQQAREAYQAGKPGVARVYYGMAASRADAQFKQLIEDEARRAKAQAEADLKTAAN